MNAPALLLAPWLATHRAMRWLGIVLFALISLGTLVVLHVVPTARGQLLACGLYALGIAYLWAFCFSASVLLAIDARQMRVPGAERTVVTGLLAYAAACVLLPMLVMSMLGGPVLLAAVLVAAALTAGLAFALLPGYLAMAVGFLPALFQAFGRAWHVGVWTPERLMTTADVVIAASVLAIAIQWPRLLRGEQRHATGLGRCMVLQFRHGGVMRWGIGQSDRQRVLQRPAWTQVEANVRASGPRRPVTSLRIALGGLYLPQTGRGWFRQISAPLACVLVFAGLLAIARLGSDQHLLDAGWIAGFVIGCGSVLSIGCVIGMPLLTATTIHRRWAGAHAELDVLALLPGLGRGDAIRRTLLRATLGRPLAVQAIFLLLTLAAAAIFRFGVVSTVYLILAQLCAALATASSVLCTLGDREPRPWARVTLAIAFGVLLSTACLISLAGPHRPDQAAWPHAGAVAGAYLVGLALLGAALTVLARRGWRGLRSRPHPFLPVADS